MQCRVRLPFIGQVPDPSAAAKACSEKGLGAAWAADQGQRGQGGHRASGIQSDTGSLPTFRLLTKESMVSLARCRQETRLAKETAKVRKRQEAAAAAEAKKKGGAVSDSDQKREEKKGEDEEDGDENKSKPNPALEAGKHLPSKLGEFPPELFGKPIEELDSYYYDKYTFVVVAKDRTIFRFSASNGLFFLSPFNPFRRFSIYVLTHPFFSLLVMLVILVNCVSMATNEEIPGSEAAFTGIYTVESTIKILARGFILSQFTYLRDAWNWLDFTVVSLAYITLAFPVGNLAALRTFRVLRALKTVAIVPGLKTIVGALMEAVRRLRDVMILTIFVLSIFALIGLQIYQGTLRNKCILDPDPVWRTNASQTQLQQYFENESNWLLVPTTGLPKLCGNNTDAGHCPENFTCRSYGPNPNFDYTSFDNFGFALLCAFRLMTQDYWENLYQMILTTNGPYHIIFFIIVIFMGSFYLVNLILAIVAMSYDDCQKMEKEEEEAEALEEARRLGQCEGSPESRQRSRSDVIGLEDDVTQRFKTRLFTQSEAAEDCSLSSPEHRRMSIISRSGHVMHMPQSVSLALSQLGSGGDLSEFSKHPVGGFQWSSSMFTAMTSSGETRHPSSNQNVFVYPHLNISIPFADDSPVVNAPAIVSEGGELQAEESGTGGRQQLVPRSEKQRHHSMCIHPSAAAAAVERERHQSGSYRDALSYRSRLGIHSLQVPGGAGGAAAVYNLSTSSKSPRHSIASHCTSGARLTSTGSGVDSERKPVEPTFFRWNAASFRRKREQSPREIPPTDEALISIQDEVTLHTTANENAGNEEEIWYKENPFVCHTPSMVGLQLEDVQVLKELVDEASGQKSLKRRSCKERMKAACEKVLFGWECYPCWYKIARVIELFIMDAFVDLFITMCIVINTVFMAMDHADMSPELTKALAIGNYVFTTIFTAEATLKILALGLYRYLGDRWNCFDVVIVVLSLVELGLANVKGLSILRSFRLLRVFKLAKSWPTLNLLIGIIGRTMGALGNLCFVLAIIIFIFAVMGMQLFGEKYSEEYFSEIPRWHFKDFLHSFMIIFRVLCGEWIESMWVCIHCAGPICFPFFLLTMIIGNLVVLNLFLALLLSSFGAESLQTSQDESEANKLQEAVDRITRFLSYLNSHLLVCIYFRLHKKTIDDQFDVAFAKIDYTGKIWFNSGLTKGGGGGGGEDGEGDALTQMLSARNREDSLDTLAPVDFTDFKSNEEEGLLEAAEQDNAVACRDYTASSPEANEETEQRPSPCQSASPMGTEGHVTSSDSFSNHPDHVDSNGSSFWSYSGRASEQEEDGQQDEDEEEEEREEEEEETLSIGRFMTKMEPPEVNEVNVVFIKYPDDCCPACVADRCTRCSGWFRSTAFGQRLWKLRCFSYSIVEHRYFETFIILMILASSLSLAIEDVNIDRKPTLKYILGLLDRLFTIIFVLEMVIKVSAYGLRKYFTDAWCWLDFVIVTISLVSLGAEGAGLGNIGAFRALRTLRALRPLRAVSRWEGMKVVVNALIQAIPAICNVLLVCLVFWLIFSIMGVNLFGGRFAACLDETRTLVNASIVFNQSQCIEMKQLNVSWVNPKINFDHVLVAYLALFQVATFKGWTDIMDHAIDSKEVAMQPEREYRVYMYLYFVFFIVFGSFFTLNLFIGVIIDNFNMQKKKAGGSMQLFMTEDQKKYYNAMKKLGSKQPQKPIPRPKLLCSMFLFNLTTNQKFDVAIMIVILLNMLTMAMEYDNMPEDMAMALGIVNQVFIAIFTTECAMKLIALRHYYFKQPWNVFDFVVVVMSILGLAMKQIIEKYLVSPTLLRVVRVFRIGRILRLIKSAKGIRTLLFSLAVSLPALFNIGLLLFLIMFIYAIFGMSFFMHVAYNNGIEELFNFETFGRSVILLFQISTSAGWNSVLEGLMIEAPECNSTHTEDRPTGDCGNSGMAILYLVSYLVISFLVVINMYIAVILENFSQATEDVQQGLTQDDFDMYFEVWERYDEAATQYIPLDTMPTLVDALENPLRVPAPNFFKLVSMDIPICQGDRVHCVDILDALTKNFLGTVTDAGKELDDVHANLEKKNYCPVSTTLRRQREIYCVKVIQRAWRKSVRNKMDIGREAEGGVGGVATAASGHAPV